MKKSICRRLHFCYTEGALRVYLLLLNYHISGQGAVCVAGAGGR